MIGLIIISKNQVPYMDQILAKVDEMTVKPDRLYYMLDREDEKGKNEAVDIMAKHSCAFFSKLMFNDKVPTNVYRPMMTPDVDYFLAGYCRNICINEALEDGCDKLVFIDGDCLPEGDIIKGYDEYLTNEKPVVLCGRRDDFSFGYTDQREHNKYRNIFRDPFTVIDEEAPVLDSAVLWSCNIGMNKAAIERLIKINTTLYGYNCVFSPIFSGRWGGEDSFLGIECFYDKEIILAGLGVPRTGITHIHHDRPKAKYGHATFIEPLRNAVIAHKYLLENYEV